jgi:hypothetical protein
MSSSGSHLELSMLMTVVFMYLNALLESVEGKMDGTFVGSWILVMPSPQVAFVGMQKIVGEMRQLRRQTALKT